MVDRGFMNPDCLAEPVTWYTVNEDVAKVMNVLTCFSGISDSIGPSPEPFDQFCGTDAPVMWLAVIIVRGGCDRSDMLLETLEWSQYFGAFNMTHFNTISYGKTMVWKNNETACSKSWVPGGKRDFFGGFLPHGLGSDTKTWPEMIADKLGRFQRIERAFRGYLKLQPEQYLQESKQDSFLRGWLYLQPGRKYSGK